MRRSNQTPGTHTRCAQESSCRAPKEGKNQQKNDTFWKHRAHRSSMCIPTVGREMVDFLPFQNTFSRAQFGGCVSDSDIVAGLRRTGAVRGPQPFCPLMRAASSHEHVTRASFIRASLSMPDRSGVNRARNISSLAPSGPTPFSSTFSASRSRKMVFYLSCILIVNAIFLCSLRVFQFTLRVCYDKNK